VYWWIVYILYPTCTKSIAIYHRWINDSSADSSIHQTVVQGAKEKIEHYIKTLIQKYPSEKYSFKAATDYDIFTDAIKQIVKAKQIDLIIMGTNGATGAKEVVFGSNTLNVIRKVDCPVITIPEKHVFTTPKTILYVMENDTDNFLETVLNPLKNICTKHNSSIRILKVRADDVISVAEYDSKKKTSKFFKDTTHSFHSITNVPTPQAIDSFVQLMNVDMTAMVVRKESLFERFFSGSNTASISYNSRVPLLIMHP